MALHIEKVKAILFDIDGTLSDTDDRMVQQVCKLLSPVFRHDDRKKAVARWMVMTAESPGNLIYNLADRFALDSFFIRYMHRFSKNKRHKMKPFWLIDGVKDMLEVLSYLPLGVVSARDERTTQAFLDQFSLNHYFGVVVTSQTCKYTKPFPDPLLHAARKLNIPAEQCLMVGDTTVDIKAARLAGMQAVGVLCGFGRENELRRAGADLILPSTADLQNLF
jgi:N-acetyl-D-muramate 6-phosphate phosphatase